MYGSQFRIVERHEGSFELHRRSSFLGLKWWSPVKEYVCFYDGGDWQPITFESAANAKEYAATILPAEENERREKAIHKATFPRVVETL